MMHAGTDADPQQRRATGAPERVRNSQESGKLFLTVWCECVCRYTCVGMKA